MAALDVLAELQNAAGVTVATSNPDTSLDAGIVLENATPGVYYLHLSGTGVGDPTSSPAVGYTDYGSLGSYAVSATYPTDPGRAPDLVVTEFGFTATYDIEEGLWWWNVLPVARVKNFGDAPAAGSKVQVYVRTASGSQYPLTVVYGHHDVLEPGEEALVGMAFHIDLTQLPTDDYWLQARVDDNDTVAESDELNNLLEDDDPTELTAVCPETPEPPNILGQPSVDAIFIQSGQTLTLEVTSVDPQGDPITYLWDFDDDGNEDVTSGPTPSGVPSTITHTFSSSPFSRKIFYVRARARADAAAGGFDLSPWSYDQESKSLVVVVDP